MVNDEQQVTILAQIDDTKCRIETEVVNSKLPRLLSKNSLKKAKTMLDMSNDVVEMCGQSETPLLYQFNESRHGIKVCEKSDISN